MGEQLAAQGTLMNCNTLTFFFYLNVKRKTPTFVENLFLFKYFLMQGCRVRQISIILDSWTSKRWVKWFERLANFNVSLQCLPQRDKVLTFEHERVIFSLQNHNCDWTVCTNPFKVIIEDDFYSPSFLPMVRVF